MRRICAGLILTAAFVLPDATTAESTSQPVLICAATCRVAGVSPMAHLEFRIVATYPPHLRRAGVEGLVKLAYDVEADGHASHIVVLTRLGPQAFADASLAALQAEVFGPGREDGKPAASRGLLRVDAFDVRTPSEHADFAAAYAGGQKLLAEGKAAEAAAAMKSALNLPALSLYEDAGAEDLLALAYLQLNDGENAMRAVGDAEVLALNANVSGALIRAIHSAHVAAAEMTHRYREALGLKDSLEALGGLLPTDDETFARLQARIDGAAPIVVHGTVPVEGTASWTYDLAHAAFSIANVTGAVTEYRVTCTNVSRESPSGGPLQAKLPSGWSDCRLAVFGTPGTTFDLTDG